MSQTIVEENIAKLLGIDTLSLEEQSAFLAEVGDVVLQTALVRLITNLTEEQQQALEQYLDSQPEPEVLLQHLLEHYKNFTEILEEVMIEFREDTQAVLG